MMRDKIVQVTQNGKWFRDLVIIKSVPSERFSNTCPEEIAILTRLLQAIRRHPLRSFYLITFTISWIFLILAYGVFKDSLFLAWIGMFAPALSALFITGVCDGKSGLERLLSRLFRWRVAWYWYAAIFGLPISLIGGTLLIHDGLPALLIWLKSLPALAPFLLGMTLLMALMTAGEEIGWRGFALPHWQARFSPLTSSLILGFLWGIWHIPAALDPTYVLNRAPLALSSSLFTLACMGLSVLYTWIWNNSGGSLLLMSLFHSFDNTLFTLTAPAYPYLIDQYWYYLIVLAVLLVPILLFSKGKFFRKPHPIEVQILNQG